KFLWDDEAIELDTAKEILKENEDFFSKRQYGLWKVSLKDNGQVIGYAGLWFFFEEPQPQLIYAQLKEFSKKGYATEYAKAVMDYSFETLGFEYLIAATDEPHVESQQVALRIGMRFVEKRIEQGKPTLFYRADRTNI
ncbi:MAG: GNAT family N-acetyltransferase, partial [Bacteroidota bacterium]